MKKLYWILGKLDEFKKLFPTDSGTASSDDLTEYLRSDDQYAYLRRIFSSGKEILIEANLQTGERLVLMDLKSKVGSGILGDGFENALLDLLLKAQQVKGYFPVRELDFETKIKKSP